LAILVLNSLQLEIGIAAYDRLEFLRFSVRSTKAEGTSRTEIMARKILVRITLIGNVMGVLIDTTPDRSSRIKLGMEMRLL
jgi:hypothetical protein